MGTPVDKASVFVYIQESSRYLYWGGRKYMGHSVDIHCTVDD